MGEHAHVVDVSKYYAADGRRDQLLDAMHRMASAASQAQGCFGAQVCSSDRDSTALVALSRWESPEALDAFAGSPDFVADREELASLLGRPAEREHYRSV